MNRHAQALGRLAKGRPKRFSRAELRHRAARIRAAKRWPAGRSKTSAKSKP